LAKPLQRIVAKEGWFVSCRYIRILSLKWVLAAVVDSAIAVTRNEKAAETFLGSHSVWRAFVFVRLLRGRSHLNGDVENRPGRRLHCFVSIFLLVPYVPFVFRWAVLSWAAAMARRRLTADFLHETRSPLGQYPANGKSAILSPTDGGQAKPVDLQFCRFETSQNVSRHGSSLPRRIRRSPSVRTAVGCDRAPLSAEDIR
jgi:hypothetical protein